MNVLLLTDSLGIGGAETHIELLSSELYQLGYKITVASSGGRIADRIAKKGIKTINIPIAPIGISSLTGFAKAYYVIEKHISNSKPDIIHAHTRKTALLAHYICKKHNIPLVVTAHAKFSMSFLKRIISKWGDSTIAVSEDIKKHLSDNGVNAAKITVIKNGVKYKHDTILLGDINEKNNICQPS